MGRLIAELATLTSRNATTAHEVGGQRSACQPSRKGENADVMARRADTVLPEEASDKTRQDLKVKTTSITGPSRPVLLFDDP